MKSINNLRQAIRAESKEQASPISGKTLQLIIGILALLLPLVLIIGAGVLAGCELVQNSISAYYHTIMRDFFVGVLCAVGVSMLAYCGYHRYDNILANVAAVAALGVAFFPTDVGLPITDCINQEIDTGWMNTIHFASAAILFFVLAIFCQVIFTISEDNPTRGKILRNRVYRICGWVIIGCILAIGVFSVLPGDLQDSIAQIRPVFVFEALALFAFSISWLTKSEYFYSG